MTYDVEWRRGDTKPLIMTITLDGDPMDLSNYSKVSICVTDIPEPEDNSHEIFKEVATVLDQTQFKGKISIDMTNNADQVVDTTFFFDVQGIIDGKTDTLVGNGLMIYRQDKNKDIN